MPISLRKGSLAITLALTIVISSSVLPNTNSSFVVKALSKNDSLYPTSSSHNSDGFFKMVDGHRNICYNDYKLASIVCIKDDGTNNDNSSTTSSLGSSTYYLHNYSQITPSNIGEGKTGRNSDDDSHNNDNNQNIQTSDNHNQHLDKLQQKIEKLQSRIDKLREQSRIQELENYGSKDSSPSSLSSLPPPAPTAMTNSTLENNTNANSTLQSLTTPPPAALSSSSASSHEGAHSTFTQDNATNKSSTTNWIVNDDDSNRNNYTYSTGLDSSPLVLPVGNTYTTSTGFSTPSSDGTINSFNSLPSKRIETTDMTNHDNANSQTPNNDVTPAKLLRDAVHVVWDDNSPESPDVYYRTNAGDMFDRKAVNLSNNPEFSESPAIAVSGNNVHIIWTDNGDISYRRSTDGGATFGSTVNLSNNPENSFGRAIAVSGNNVYVVWHDFVPGNTPDGEENAEISYRRSTDGGATFGSTVNLSNNAGLSQSPAIAVSGNNVYVVWGDNTPGNDEISYRRSTDGGATFGSTVNLSNSVGDSQLPAIAVSGNNVYVVWQDSTSGDNNIFYRRSTNNGSTFGSTVNLSNSPGGTPDIAASANSVHVTWTDSTSGNQEIYYKRSTNNGATFGSTVNLSNNAGLSQSPAISVSGNNVYVIWQDSTPGDFEIVLRKSINGGTAFGSTINVSQSTGNSFSPDISVSPNNF
jgi:hypothetical protein